LHNDAGPAIAFRDGWALYYVHGVRVTRQIVERPETLTVAQIAGEANVEVRRVMIDRFGQDRYLTAAGARQVHTDDWGTLWRVDFPDDESLVMVEVLNATAEPDGSFKTYFLRVDPLCRTAREAVAWTFAETADDYQPAMQT
jgi:hypothetical protein